ncbi:MAG: cytochrome P450 [Chloroflexi bacterium]|nr:cytochrome P450 [Chloroflexota bacterium]
MTNHPTPDWDPRDISVLGDQRRVYDEMRERCPVAYSHFLDWSLFRHQDVVNVLADPETYSSASKRRAIPNGMDPPEHTHYNRALAPYFQPEQMKALEPGCRRIAVDLLEEMLACGGDELDFIPEFAQPFPIKTLCLFLGWPQETWEKLRGWTHGNQEVAFSQNKEAGAALAREFTGYVMEALRVRREVRGHASGDLTDTTHTTHTTHTTLTSDVTASIMGITVGGVVLSDEDIVSILRNWTAGQGTVAASIGILVYYLARHTDMQERLRSGPALLPAAIDEILRADGPLVANRRSTTRAVEIEGRKIDAGEHLSLNWISANRDARAFDDPDVVRLDRNPADNLLFGAGIHYCLGAPLARLEMKVAMEELLARTTTIELGAADPPRRHIYPSNGFGELPVRLR